MGSFTDLILGTGDSSKSSYYDPFDFVKKDKDDYEGFDFGTATKGERDSFFDSLDVGFSTPEFDDSGFTTDFLDALSSGDFSVYYDDKDDYDAAFSALPGLLGLSTTDDKSFLSSILGGGKKDKPSGFRKILNSILGTKGGSGGVNLGELGLGLGLASLLKDRGAFKPDVRPVGYQGKVPEYTAVREQVTGRDDTDRRPGSAGRRYFSDVIFAEKPKEKPMSVEEARAQAKEQVSGFTAGGTVLQDGGYLEGDTDGQADLVPGSIDGVQEALLSHGEFVLPADVVAMLGNGNSNAGAEALDDFMKSVRREATGTPKQQRNIDADEVLMMLSKRVR